MAMSGPKKTVLQLVGVVVLMGGLSWASVPFYDWFCRVTGFGGVTGVATVGSDEILDQTITIRFDASKAADMPWEFKPVARQVEMRIGETGLAFYEAYNPTDRPIAGAASYNVTPYSAGAFFEKIQCFCFEEIVTDRDGKYVHTITLSYTFHEIDLPEDYAVLDTKADGQTN